MMKSIFLFLITMSWMTIGMADERLQVRDLSQISSLSEKKQIPILLIVSQSYCSYCEKLKEEVIHPMLASGAYVDKVIIVEILLDDFESIVNFDGIKTDPSNIAQHYKVFLTPTLLFLNKDGRELRKRMIGVNTTELFGHYLDNAIEESIIAIKDNDQSYKLTSEDANGGLPSDDLIFQ